MELREEIAGMVAVVALVGRLDSNTSPEVTRVLTERIAAGNARLVLDMSATQYLSSAGLRVLLVVAKQIARLNGRFVLHGLNARVRDVLDISGLLNELTICADRGEAVALAGA